MFPLNPGLENRHLLRDLIFLTKRIQLLKLKV